MGDISLSGGEWVSPVNTENKKKAYIPVSSENKENTSKNFAKCKKANRHSATLHIRHLTTFDKRQERKKRTKRKKEEYISFLLFFILFLWLLSFSSFFFSFVLSMPVSIDDIPSKARVDIMRLLILFAWLDMGYRSQCWR